MQKKNPSIFENRKKKNTKESVQKSSVKEREARCRKKREKTKKCSLKAHGMGYHILGRVKKYSILDKMRPFFSCVGTKKGVEEKHK